MGAMVHRARLGAAALALALGCSDEQSSSGTTGGGGAGTSSTTAAGGSGANGGAGGGGATGGQAPCGASDGYFPQGAWMYQNIEGAAVHADSDAITQWLADDGGWGTGEMRIDFSIEVLQKTADTPYMPFEPTGDFYTPDCDQVDVPVPPGGALEGESGYECTTDGDCHLIVVDCDQNRLFEMWRANITGGTFQGGCLAAWDMTRVYGPEGRGEQCSSADAAGFPIAPLLFTADEVAAGDIRHAIRFILPNARMRDGFYTRPGSHAGGPSGPAPAPVYAGRWRLRADFDLDTLPSEGARVVARAMQRYGMALADGGNIALTAQSDRFTTAKWEGLLDTYDLGSIQPTDFEVLDTGPDIVLTYDCVRAPY
jgi:serine/threonine-protein kinase